MDNQPEGLFDSNKTSKSQREKIKLQEQSAPYSNKGDCGNSCFHIETPLILHWMTVNSIFPFLKMRKENGRLL